MYYPYPDVSMPTTRYLDQENMRYEFGAQIPASQRGQQSDEQQAQEEPDIPDGEAMDIDNFHHADREGVASGHEDEPNRVEGCEVEDEPEDTMVGTMMMGVETAMDEGHDGDKADSDDQQDMGEDWINSSPHASDDEHPSDGGKREEERAKATKSRKTAQEKAMAIRSTVAKERATVPMTAMNAATAAITNGQAKPAGERASTLTMRGGVMRGEDNQTGAPLIGRASCADTYASKKRRCVFVFTVITTPAADRANVLPPFNSRLLAWNALA